MAKLTEKQLYITWLEIWYADKLNDDLLFDLLLEVKLIRKHRTKTKRMLKKATEHYKSVYGKEPKKYK